MGMSVIITITTNGFVWISTWRFSHLGGSRKNQIVLASPQPRFAKSPVRQNEAKGVSLNYKRGLPGAHILQGFDRTFMLPKKFQHRRFSFLFNFFSLCILSFIDLSLCLQRLWLWVPALSGRWLDYMQLSEEWMLKYMNWEMVSKHYIYLSIYFPEFSSTTPENLSQLSQFTFSIYFFSYS